MYENLISVWQEGNITATQTRGVDLIDFLGDLDMVLGTNDGFVLGKWIGDAIRWADGNETYAAYLEYNARNQVPPLAPSLHICVSTSVCFTLSPQFPAVRVDLFLRWFAYLL